MTTIIRNIILGICVVAIVLVGAGVSIKLLYPGNVESTDANMKPGKLYSLAETYEKEEKYDEALAALGKIDGNWEKYEDVISKKSEIMQQRTIKKVKEFQKDEKYADAISYIDTNVTDIYSNPEIEQLYKESLEKYKEKVTGDAETYVKNGEYDAAISILTTALKVTDDDLIKKAIQEVKKDSALDEINTYKQNSDYASAIQCLYKYIDSIGEDETILAELGDCEKEFREQTIAAAEEQYKKNGYDSAIDEMNKGLAVLKDDEILLEERSKYESLIPVALADLSPYIGELEAADPYSDANVDNMGNAYGQCYFAYASECEATYAIDREYNVLKATVAVGKPMRSDETFDGVLRIYGDGRVLWEDSDIKSGIRPYQIEVDITGVADLRILIDSNGPGAIMLADAILQKTNKQ